MKRLGKRMSLNRETLRELGGNQLAWAAGAAPTLNACTSGPYLKCFNTGCRTCVNP